jgi:two-component system sensor histidine kinase TtrS
VLLLLFSLGWGMAAQAGEWSVGVLAMRGDAATARDWQPLIDSLNGSVGGERFRLQPLDLAQMREAVNRGSVQFVVTNPTATIICAGWRRCAPPTAIGQRATSSAA